MMKNSFALTLVLSATSLRAEIPHLEMELTGPEYRALLEKRVKVPGEVDDEELNAILAMGKRNLDWLAFINAARPSADRLALTTPETQHAYPVEAPKESNRTIVLDANTSLKSRMPQAMNDILFGGAEFTVTPPIADVDYLVFAREANGIYESASRWLLEAPYFLQYAARARNDIRGYYFLKNEVDLDQKLQGWANLAQADKDRLKGHLLNECRNTTASLASCATEFDRLNNPPRFHQRYVNQAKKTYEAYFAISTSRSDVEWTAGNPDEMRVPFKSPERQDIRDYLSTNIEDEWKWNGWQLRLDFKPEALTHVVFEAGVTPHVDGLAGSEITMDANTSLTDYNTQWTIRHEYGHTLGFPDCYVEFYDRDRGVMINYQIDTTDLMCSRRGHINQQHIDELKKTYFR